ncbi:MAG TPA: hypothetical protein VNO14_06745 [Blastocatellia bacterium]|jgi:ElaB/YqjD/DUF883 family membrane-anchored ribosome-binding protein|nr:hypothetical protein [Blastocatellia bacterium]
MFGILALCISIVSLIIASVAYLRSGGRQDIRAAEQALSKKIEELGSLVRRTGDSLVASVRAGYERSLRAIGELRTEVAALGEAAVEEVREDLRALADTLNRLAERASQEIQEVKSGMGAAVVEAEEKLRRAVDEAGAQLAVIEAKQQLALARIALSRENVTGAESHVETALAFIKTARRLTTEHTAGLEGLQKQAQQMLIDIREKASDLQGRLRSLIERNNQVLAEMGATAARSARAVA